MARLYRPKPPARNLNPGGRRLRNGGKTRKKSKT